MPLSTGAMANLGTVSHEFFHPWNMERIRPASLDPFDFEEANMAPARWFAEGFVSYYAWGAAIGLGLDLTLDDYMRAVGDPR